MSRFETVAENIATLLSRGGNKGQVVEILKAVHKDAIEMVAEDFNKRAIQTMNREGADPQEARFYQAQVRNVRALKNGPI